jgi:transcriptional regulator with XRE-family HTH domain
MSLSEACREWRKRDKPAQWHRWRGRATIPHGCHPLVRQFVEAMNEQMTTLLEVSERSGVSRPAISDWRYNRNPSITNFNAVLNVLGLELCIRKKRDQ